MKKTLISILVLGLLAGIIGYVATLKKSPTAVSPATGTSTWVTYQNEKYDFKIDHPSDWTVSVSDTDLDPKINIYKKSETAKPPFIHHNDVANVSIFPEGVATEGVLGSSTSSEAQFSEQTNQAIDYVLENGDRWATLASFKNTPESWQEYGFVWARATIANHVQKCTLDGKEVIVDRCHALGEPGAVLTDSGNINAEERAIEEKIMESFEFLKD